MDDTDQIAKSSSDLSPREPHGGAMYLVRYLKKTRDLGVHCRPNSEKGFECCTPLFMITIITAKASTVADDLGVVSTDNAAIEGALKNNAPLVPRCCMSFLLPESLVMQQSRHTMISPALSSTKNGNHK